MTATIDVHAIASGSSAAAAAARTTFAKATAEDRKALLDALTASAQNRHCLDVLLAVLRDHRVLHPPIRRYLMTDDDIDGAEQQALVSIAFKVETYSGAGAALSWMNQIAANEAKMLIRSRDRHSSRAAGTVDDHSADFVQRLSTFVADQATIDRCLGALRPEWKSALLLREEGRSYDDVALMLQVPVGTAKTWVSRARRALADLLIEHSMIG